MIDLELSMRKYVSAIKQNVQDNFELWNEVPYWAAHAQGRTGYLDSYTLCYKYGIWKLDNYCYVDCASAELVGWGSDGIYQALDSYIVSLNIKKLDVSKVLTQLREDAKMPVSTYIGAPSKDLLAAKQLPIKYKRLTPVPPPSYSYY